MEVAKSEGNAHTVELGSCFRELPRFPEVHEQLTTSDELHHEKYLEVCLEHELHTDEEWMISFLQDVLLEHGRLNLVVVENNILPEGLHRVHCLGVLFLHEEHLAKATFSNDLLDLEGVQISWFFVFAETPLEDRHCSGFRKLCICLL